MTWYSSVRQVVSPGWGRWYFTEGTTRRLRARPTVQDERRRSRYSSRVCHQPRPFQVTVQPSSPDSTALIRSTVSLRFLDRPGRHGLGARGVLGDHGLEHDEGEARVGGFLDRREIEGKLAGCLAPGVSEGNAGVRGRHVEAVCLLEVGAEPLGQSLERKAVVVARDETKLLGRDDGSSGQQMRLHESFTLGGLRLLRGGRRTRQFDRIQHGRARAPRVVGCFRRNDVLMNEAPEHALDVAFHGSEERMLGEVVDQRTQGEEFAGAAFLVGSQQSRPGAACRPPPCRSGRHRRRTSGCRGGSGLRR